MEHAELFLLLPVYEEATDQSAYVKRIGILEEEEYEKLRLRCGSPWIAHQTC